MPDDLPKEKHEHHPLNFPADFLWGSATSAYQVEGNNTASDWWAWEQTLPESKRSREAADQYNRYEEDFDLAQSLNQNAHRLSIEWSRIEPEEGQFNPVEIEHYVKVLKALKVRKFRVMLTLWHFTLPEWLSKIGGWENTKAIFYFHRFVAKILPETHDYVDFWVTLNEPSVYAYMAYLSRTWPPKKKSNWAAFLVSRNLVEAHKKVYDLIHQEIPRAKVGIAHNIQSFEAFHKHSFKELMAVEVGDFLTNHLFYFLTKGKHDFLGINYYFHHRFEALDNFIPKILDVEKKHRDVSDLGWEIYPEGLFEVLTDLADHLPIYVTECGIASTNDDRRTRFLINYLQEIYRAINLKIPVKGFFYWSLIDNFEWHQGFEPRFGLIEVDYKTQKRQARPSAYVYSEIIKHNGIPHSYLKLLGHTVRAEEVLCTQHDAPKAFCEHIISSRYPHYSKPLDVMLVKSK